MVTSIFRLQSTPSCTVNLYLQSHISSIAKNSGQTKLVFQYMTLGSVLVCAGSKASLFYPIIPPKAIYCRQLALLLSSACSMTSSFGVRLIFKQLL